jgi:hypothetical protein
MQGALEPEGQGMKRACAAESDYMARVAAIGCVLCRHLGLGPSPAEIHHVKEGQGLSQRAPNWLTIPLCPEHHRGASGLHGLGTKGFYTRYKLDELDLLAFTIEWLNCQKIAA